jgi:hypothetical protein
MEHLRHKVVIHDVAQVQLIVNQVVHKSAALGALLINFRPVLPQRERLVLPNVKTASVANEVFPICPETRFF